MLEQSSARQERFGENFSPIRVLIWCPRATEVPGGHIIQLRETANALRDLGVDVVESTASDPVMEHVDLIHGYGLHAGEVHQCRQLGLPVVLSTIYWDREYRVGTAGPKTLRALLGALSASVHLGRASLRSGSATLNACLIVAGQELRLAASFTAADMLLPNARGEGRNVREELGVETPLAFVPNAVDPSRFDPGDKAWAERDTVLYVGRIEPNKNQLGLIKALRGRGYRVVIAGVPHPHHPHYLEECHKAGRGEVTFHRLPATLDQAELPALYQSARVHVLPSWFETTGLVSLEAALSGCSVVTTSRGHAAEYFGELAWYCDPADPASIVQAVDQAWNTPPNPDLRQRILSHYTWEEAAKATLKAYRKVLYPRQECRAEAGTA